MATTEQAISGQMGHPAACMMENKGVSDGRAGSGDGRGEALSDSTPTMSVRNLPGVGEMLTFPVDKYVENCACMCRQPAPFGKCDRSVTNSAEKNLFKSMCCNEKPSFAQGSVGADRRLLVDYCLWTNQSELMWSLV
jgi:hypothetical protein